MCAKVLRILYVVGSYADCVRTRACKHRECTQSNSPLGLAVVRLSVYNLFNNAVYASFRQIQCYGPLIKCREPNNGSGIFVCFFFHLDRILNSRSEHGMNNAVDSCNNMFSVEMNLLCSYSCLFFIKYVYRHSIVLVVEIPMRIFGGFASALLIMLAFPSRTAFFRYSIEYIVNLRMYIL